MYVTFVSPPYRKEAHQHPPFTPLGIGYLAAARARYIWLLGNPHGVGTPSKGH